jgi:hypothetical protein
MQTYKQPTAAMTRKQFWTTMSAGTVTLTFWALDTFAGVAAEPLIVGTAVGMAGAIVGYVVKERLG